MFTCSSFRGKKTQNKPQKTLKHIFKPPLHLPFSTLNFCSRTRNSSDQLLSKHLYAQSAHHRSGCQEDQMFGCLTPWFLAWSETNVLETTASSASTALAYLSMKLDSFMLLPHLTSSLEHSGQCPVKGRGEVRKYMWM